MVGCSRRRGCGVVGGRQRGEHRWGDEDRFIWFDHGDDGGTPDDRSAFDEHILDHDDLDHHLNIDHDVDPPSDHDDDVHGTGNGASCSDMHTWLQPVHRTRR
jgi:hypothetical protein